MDMRKGPVVVTLLAACLLAPAAAQAAERPSLAVQVLSNRADLISAGDALVAVGLPNGVDPRERHA